MPFLSFTSNAVISEEQASGLAKALSEAVAAGSGKPERYVQVAVPHVRSEMLLAGSEDPTVYMDVKAVGLLEPVAHKLSGLLTAVVERELGIPPDRVYISFASYAGSMWGFNGETF